MAKPDLVYVTANASGNLFAETGLSSTHEALAASGGGLGTFVQTALPATVASTVGTVFATTAGTLTITGATNGQTMFIRARVDDLLGGAVTIVDANSATLDGETFAEIRAEDQVMQFVFTGTAWLIVQLSA